MTYDSGLLFWATLYNSADYHVCAFSTWRTRTYEPEVIILSSAVLSRTAQRSTVFYSLHDKSDRVYANSVRLLVAHQTDH